MFEAGRSLTLEREGLKDKTVLRGWKSGQYMLVDIPSGLWGTPSTAPIIGKLSSAGVARDFKTEFLGVLRELKLLILKYPSNIVDTTNRASSRFHTTLPVTVLGGDSGGEERNKGVITNISEGGCQVVCPACSAELNIGDKLYLRACFAADSIIEKVPCELRSSTRLNDQIVYNVAFDIAAGDNLDAVKDFLNNLDLFNLQDKKKSAYPEPVDYIPTGEFCQVQIDDAKYSSVFRGHFSPDYFLMDIPAIKGNIKYIPHDCPIIIRFVHKGMAYGFEAALIRMYTKPHIICVMEYPEKMKSIHLRKSLRLNVFLASRLRTERLTVDGAITDLSEGGCLYSTAQAGIGIGEKCFLESDLPNGEKIERLVCQARSLQKSGNKTVIGLDFGKHEAGLSFDQENGDSYSLLKSYYDECVIGHAAPLSPRVTATD